MFGRRYRTGVRVSTLWKLAVPLSTVATLPLLITPLSASASPASSLPNCHSSFNPYAYSRAAVAACGFPTFPLTATQALPGGGSSYDYMVNGHLVKFKVPPPGFHPSTASSANLKEYGLPPRPAAARPLAQWQAQMRSWRGAAKPPPFLAETHVRSDTVTLGNWSGYSLSGSPGTYADVEAVYGEPTLYSSQCSTNAESTWTGIGGYQSQYLGQNGTGAAQGIPGIGQHQAWWEVVPDESEVPINLYAHPSNDFGVVTRWLGSYYEFYWYDYYSGQSQTVDDYTSSYDGTSAEAIVERPAVSGQWTYLSNFGTADFVSTYSSGLSFDQYSPNGVRHGIHMYDTWEPSTQTWGGTQMADPSAIGSGGFFTDTQDSCK